MTEVKETPGKGTKPSRARSRKPNGGRGRRRVPGRTRLSSKNQVTLPVEVVRKAGLRPGMELRVVVDEQGNVLIAEQAEADLIDELSGSLSDAWPEGALERLREADLEREKDLGLPVSDAE